MTCFTRILLACLAALVCAPSLPAEKVYFNGQDFKAGYYIVPDNMPGDGFEVWVVVDVHGAGGLKGEGRGPELAKLLEPQPVIVIVPSFTSGYQGGDGEWAKQLIDNFKTVRERHPVHDRMFVHGHSGGGQFAHRFAFEHPDKVIGVSAHSSGSWACAGGYGSISTRARDIPFAISCGEEDKAYSVQGYPHTRIEWYRLFAAELERKGFVLSGRTWPGVGHGVSPGLYGPQLRECFLLATRGIVPPGDSWKGDVAKLADKARRKYGGLATPAADAADLEILHAANDRILAGQAPDPDSTLRFLIKHPAPTWTANESLRALRTHCRQAARTYLEQQAQTGRPLAGEGLDRFRRVTKGLGLEQGETGGE